MDKNQALKMFKDLRDKLNTSQVDKWQRDCLYRIDQACDIIERGETVIDQDKNPSC